MSVSALIMSITGHTTVLRSSLIGVSSGCSHISFTSQWLSRNTSTFPAETQAHMTQRFRGNMKYTGTHASFLSAAEYRQYPYNPVSQKGDTIYTQKSLQTGESTGISSVTEGRFWLFTFSQECSSGHISLGRFYSQIFHPDSAELL